MTEDYRVNLEIYNGPLDLLLYLIKRDEVDIYDIPIARVTAQYVEYVDLMQQLDPNLAGDFLVMAATLIEIKTRMLLPSVAVDDGGEEASPDDLDPRAELVRQLLQYKAFKDAAADLEAAAIRQEQRFPRRPGAIELPSDEPDKDLEDIQIWDLFDAFNRLLASIGADKPTHDVIYDDTPIHTHAEDILDRLTGEGPQQFSRLFAGRKSRGEMVGLFLAILELMKQKRILCRQEGNFGEIRLELNPNPPPDEPEPLPEPAEGPEG